MAAPDTFRIGGKYRVKVGGNTIGGEQSGTLVLTLAQTVLTNKGSNYFRKLAASMRSWRIESNGNYVVSSAEIAGNNLSATVAGTAIKGIRSLAISGECQMIEVANSTTGLDRALLPGVRSMDATVQGDWYDFDLDSSPTGGDEALEDLQNILLGTSSDAVAFVGQVGTNQTFAFDALPSSNSLSMPNEDSGQYSVTVNSADAITATQTGADTALAAIVSAFAGASEATSVSIEFTPDEVDATEWTGTAYVGQIELNAEFTGDVTWSTTLEGTGALTQQAGS